MPRRLFALALTLLVSGCQSTIPVEQAKRVAASFSGPAFVPTSAGCLDLRAPGSQHPLFWAPFVLVGDGG
jgi:CHAT domain-containing protein